MLLESCSSNLSRTGIRIRYSLDCRARRLRFTQKRPAPWHGDLSACSGVEYSRVLDLPGLGRQHGVHSSARARTIETDRLHVQCARASVGRIHFRVLHFFSLCTCVREETLSCRFMPCAVAANSSSSNLNQGKVSACVSACVYVSPGPVHSL